MGLNEILAKFPNGAAESWAHWKKNYGVGMVMLMVSDEMPDGTRSVRVRSPEPASEINMARVFDDARMFSETGVPSCVIHVRELRTTQADSIVDYHFIQKAA